MSREFRKGTELIKQHAAKKSSGKRLFTPSIWWNDGDVKTIAFLTEAEEIPKILLHKMVRVPDDRFKSGFRYETIICKKDPSMVEEFNGVCELCDEVGHEPAEQFVALAVELEPVKEGKRVTSLRVKTDAGKDKDDNDVEWPRWGLVIQASRNFFSYFAAYSEASGDIRDVAWEIHREGSSTNTKYHPFVVMNGPNAVTLPDLSELVENIPTLGDLLEGMASEEKYAEVAELEPGSQPSFGGKKSPQNDGVIPSGDRDAEFAKIRAEVVEAY